MSSHLRIALGGGMAVLALMMLWPFLAGMSCRTAKPAFRSDEDQLAVWCGGVMRGKPDRASARPSTRPAEAASRATQALPSAARHSDVPQLSTASEGPSGPCDVTNQEPMAPATRVATSRSTSPDVSARLDDILAGLTPGTRKEAIRAVLQISRLGVAAAPIIVERLQVAGSKDEAVLGAALLVIDVPSGAARLSAMLSAEDEATRLAAVAALQLARNRPCVGLLADAVEKGPSSVTARATDVLKELAALSGLQVEDVLASRISGHAQPFAIAFALAAIGTDASRRQLHWLAGETDRANGQIAALQAMVALGAQADPEVVVKAIANASSPPVMRQAAITAGMLRIGRSVPDLIDLLEEADSQVARDVGWALCAITGESLMPDAGIWRTWWENVGRLKDWSGDGPRGR